VTYYIFKTPRRRYCMASIVRKHRQYRMARAKIERWRARKRKAWQRVLKAMDAFIAAHGIQISATTVPVALIDRMLARQAQRL
jgi:hypothetical protein